MSQCLSRVAHVARVSSMDSEPAKRPILQQSIGRGVTLEAVKRTLAAAQQFSVDKDFEVPYGLLLPWIGLESHPTTRQLIDEWTKSEDNLKRAAAAVGRPLRSMVSTSHIVRDWGAVRSTRLSSPGKLRGLEMMPDPHGETLKDENTAAVIMSLDGKPLLRDVALGEGEDICIDGKDDVVFHGPGGSHAVIFILRL